MPRPLRVLLLLLVLAATALAAARPAAAVVPGAPPTVATGYLHACAVLGDGAVRCWGENDDGQLGTGDWEPIGDDEAPGDVPAVDLGEPARAVAAGGAHTCALLASRRVRCWGDNRAGQLGQGAALERNRVGDDEPVRSIGLVALGGRVTALSAGWNHTCALLEGGTVRCWGWSFGVGSDDDIGDDERPVDVAPMDLGGRAIAVDAGVWHSCAVLRGGAVRCWGYSIEPGVLGTGDNREDEPSPRRGRVDVGGRAVDVTAGKYHSCALLASGQVRCWGIGAAGRLGLGGGRKPTVGDDEAPSAVAPVRLGGRAVAVEAGDAHTCALLAGGDVVCWGYGRWGRLGYGDVHTVGIAQTPAAAGRVETGGAAAAIAAGGNYSCAVLERRALRCWGRNRAGQLGLGHQRTVGDDETPASVAPVALGGRPARSGGADVADFTEASARG